MTLSKKRYTFILRTLVFIHNKDKYLLIRKNRKGSFRYGKWNGVGGHIEKREDPFSSAKREIFEETNLTVNKLELTAIIFIDSGKNRGIEVFVFDAEYAGGEERKSLEGELLWTKLEEINASNQILDDVPMLIDICRQHQAGRQPKFIKYSLEENNELRIVNIQP